MPQIDDFFLSSNTVSDIPEGEYQKVDVLIDSFDALSRITYQSLYIIDYHKKNFLYVSNNPLFLCGHSAEEVQKLGYMFYLKHVPEEEQAMLLEINQVGFQFFSKIPIEKRLYHTISYSFHLVNQKKKILINHSLTPILLTNEGKIWLAACVVSLPSRNTIGNIEIRQVNEASFWKYSIEDHCWKEDKGVILNEKERDILSLSAQGYIMKEIADKLCLALDTVKFHKRNLFEKLEVKNITEAIAFATNNKLF
ncbi:MAG: helix-turn-helix transcriptional regulator [Tannerellaceae bacterium]|jgi:DNA-binding CsgD family transcriptional regulator|nr:helix-turn-helix transcriptional regulator [Tannerellaceae bacterium]